MIDYFINGLLCSALAFCLLGWYLTSIYFYAHIPIARQPRTSLPLVIARVIKAIVVMAASAAIWWYISGMVIQFFSSLYKDPFTVLISYRVAIEKLHHIGWIVIMVILLTIISTIGSVISNLIIPRILMRIANKLPEEPKTLTERIKVSLFLRFASVSGYVLFALSLIVTIPMLHIIFGT